jgi:hypothetical protein
MKFIPYLAAVPGLIIGWKITPIDFGVTYGMLHRMSLLELAFNIGLGIYPIGLIGGLAYGLGKARHLNKTNKEFISYVFVNGIKVLLFLPAGVGMMFLFIGIVPLLLESPLAYFVLIVFEKIIYTIGSSWTIWFFFQVILNRPLKIEW